ncbi:hypothetical protein ABZ471_48600 [Streptomyces sp. NPDC005728]|uniref:hypothetical protein n=1 Tax=Streptomyces sp. NPDC005728 TaxID=3157054 RepID=UPI0033DB65E6
MLLEASHGRRVSQEHAGIENVRAPIAMAGTGGCLGPNATLFVDHRCVSDPLRAGDIARLFE